MPLENRELGLDPDCTQDAWRFAVISSGVGKTYKCELREWTLNEKGMKNRLDKISEHTVSLANNWRLIEGQSKKSVIGSCALALRIVSRMSSVIIFLKKLRLKSKITLYCYLHMTNPSSYNLSWPLVFSIKCYHTTKRSFKLHPTRIHSVSSISRIQPKTFLLPANFLFSLWLYTPNPR